MKIHDREFIVYSASNELVRREMDIFSVGTPYCISIGIISDVLNSISRQAFYKHNKIVFERLPPEDLNDEFPSQEWKDKYFQFISIVDSIIEKYELTHGEISRILSECIGTNAKYEIRVERHGNSDKKGGEE